VPSWPISRSRKPTAKALTNPPSLLQRADQAIE